jgi:hypothetical protein
VGRDVDTAFRLENLLVYLAEKPLKISVHLAGGCNNALRSTLLEIQPELVRRESFLFHV